jgi:hypothetical protein
MEKFLAIAPDYGLEIIPSPSDFCNQPQFVTNKIMTLLFCANLMQTSARIMTQLSQPRFLG